MAASSILPIVFVAYYPMQLIFGIWLPDYKESLSYIAVLLPLCTYDGKMQMLCNTYFKVLRKENFLLFINAGAALISFIICSFSAHVLGSITAVVYSMVLSVALRSIISELYLARMLNKKVGSSIILESSLLMNYACTKMIDASVLLYFSFDSSFSQSRSMGQAVPAVHLTF